MSDVLFVSGLTHQELQAGQHMTIDHLQAIHQQALREAAVILAAQQQQAAAANRNAGTAAAVAQAAAKLPVTAPSFKELLDANVIRPGQVLSVVHKGATAQAPLTKDGVAVFDGAAFQNASTFSAHVKQLPSGVDDECWQCVLLDGRPLVEARIQYLHLAVAAAAGSAGAGRGHHMKAHAGMGRGAGAAAAAHHRQPAAKVVEEDDDKETDQWVQCSKCQTWRQVPDEFWPDIANADEDEDWTCKDALWDLMEYEPHTRPCC